MSQGKLLGISGSLREGSFSTAILRALREIVGEPDELEVVTLHEVPLFNQDLEVPPPPGVAMLREKVQAADGIVIVSPEYNHGIPGVLKNGLDWLSRPLNGSVMKGKPVLTVTSSPGAVGGARAQAQLNETLAAMQARMVARPQSVIGFVRDKMQEGEFTDAASLAFLAEGVEDLHREIERLR